MTYPGAGGEALWVVRYVWHPEPLAHGTLVSRRPGPTGSPGPSAIWDTGWTPVTAPRVAGWLKCTPGVEC